jgi:Terminase small subunit
MEKPDGLTRREAVFVREYLVDLNAAAAARRAGYSARSARFQASRLLTKANVSEAVAEAHSDRLRRLDLSADSLLQELARVGYTDVDGSTRVRDFAKVAALKVLLRHRERFPEPAGSADERFDLATLSEGELYQFRFLAAKMTHAPIAEVEARQAQLVRFQTEELIRWMTAEEREVFRRVCERRLRESGG